MALRSAIVAAILIVVSVVGYHLGWFDSTRVEVWAVNMRHQNDVATNALIFIAVWAISTTFSFPGVPLMIAGGVLFGTIAGTLLSLVGTALGALGGYYLARLVAHQALSRWLHRKVPQLGMSTESGFLAVTRFRLLPLLPISFGSYAAGLAQVALTPFLAGTVVGQAPSTLAYTYLGDRLVITARHGTSQIGTDVAIISAALFVLTFLPWLIRRFVK